MAWQRRHSILGILFCAYLLCYMDRMAMASSIPFIANDFHLSPFAQGAVLSAFFFGYALMQLPGGFLADRFGPGRVMTASIAGWSCFTALTGLASSFGPMLCIRFLFGLSEGPFPPAASKTVALWFQPHEVGRANGLQLAAVNIGAALSPLIVAPLVVNWGWRAFFYTLLIPGMALALAVRFAIQDSPAQQSRGKPVIHAAGIHVTEVLKRPVILWCSVVLFFSNIAGWGLMNWLPTYLLQARGFSVTGMGIGASLPYLAGAVGYYLSGHVSDKYFAQQRYIPIMCGLVLGAAATYWAAIAPTGEWAIVALVLAFLFLFAATAGLFTLPLIVVPQNAVGVAFGFVNTVGQVAAFLSPLLVGYVLNATGGRFTLVFYGFVGLLIVAALAAIQLRQPMLQTS